MYKLFLSFFLLLLVSKNISAQSCNCCSQPSEAASVLTFSNIGGNSVTLNYIAASGADGYLIIKSSAASIKFFPEKFVHYTTGSFGTGEVVTNTSATTYTVTGLSNATQYYFSIYAYKNCSEGIRYYQGNPLTGNVTTLPVCTVPLAQPSGLTFGTVASNSIAGSFTPSAATEYLIIRSTSSALSSNPVNGVHYAAGDVLGGGFVESSGTATSFNSISLSSNTTYYFFIFSYNNSNCSGGPLYKTSGPLTGSQTTLLPACTAPSSQATLLSFSAVTSSSVTGTFTPAAVSGHLVLMSTSSSLTQQPVNGVIYNNGATLGNATVVGNASGSYTVTSLASNTTYYFHIYSFNNTSCIGGPVYLTASPLQGAQSTLLPACVAPSAQATSLSFSGITSSSITGSFTQASATGHLVLMSTSASLTQQPVNGNTYTNGSSLGNATVISNSAGSFTASSLSSNTTYYFYIYSFNNTSCLGGPVYLTANPLAGSQTTLLPACTVPSAQATSLIFSGITSSSITGTFTQASASGYVVLMSSSTSLSQQPVNGTTYTDGTTVGNATVIGNTAGSFTASSLSSNTTYYFFIYSYNNSGCLGGPAYLTASPLSGSQTTSLPACVAPSSQATSLGFSGITISSITGTFTPATASGHLVLMSTSASLTQQPVDGTTYTGGSVLGNATVISNSAGSFTASSLSSSTTYYFFIYSYNNTGCLGGPAYLTASPLSGSQVTASSACTTPASQATGLSFSTVTYNSIAGSFTGVSGADHIVLMTLTSGLSTQPTDGVVYSVGATLGNATVVSNTGTTFTASNLSSNTIYYFYVLSYKNAGCTGGPKYRTASPLTGNQSTGSPTSAQLNFYYGNLHAHSAYSDGNMDDVSKTPADDYNYAKTALCFDFLGICEHNHAEAGMNISSWQPGITQANAATTSDFVALHGMEWGTISTGGHVVIYGIDSLIGWETNNYQIFVAKGDYTGTNGLFKILNRNGNAFGYLAHPDQSNTDFNSLVLNAYDSVFDRVIIGSAVESGPAFSTGTTYNDYPASMGYLTYFRNMLAKGYKVGPTMDHDNHNMTFGKTVTSRLVILAPTLTKENLLASMKQRRFFASQDCAAKVTFSIGTNPMGSIITQSGAPVLNISTILSSSVSSIKIYSGVPGSGSNATQLTSSASTSFSFTDTGLTSGNTKYYYLDITESDGKRIISAPIWYTRQ